MTTKSLDLAHAETSIGTSAWDKQDTVWMLSIFGTAIGAGTLFLPINAGLSGIWPLIVMLILAFPMTYFSHHALCRFVLSGSGKKDITAVMEEHFGSKMGNVLVIFYFFAIYPILLMYSVAITNTTQSFIVNQLGLESPPRALLAIILVLGLMFVISQGQQIIIKLMSILVYPFITMLMFLSVYLIPHWNNAIFQQSSSLLVGDQHSSFLMTIWLIIPVMVFSFNHSPIISAFALNQKERFGEAADKKCNAILKNSHIMMVFTVMFFVLSCVFSLTPADLFAAKQQNISILSYLANHFHTPIIAYLAPWIAFIAIAKSFFGHYLGVREGLGNMLVKYFRFRNQDVSNTTLQRLIGVFLISSCWLIATINPSILGMIEMLSGPVIAVMLFLMPMYAIATVPALQKYRTQKLGNGFTVIIGVIAVSAILYGLVWN
jgi:serine transporter